MFELLSSIGDFIASIGRVILFSLTGFVNGIGLVASSVSNSLVLVGWLPHLFSACIFAFFIIGILRICIELL